MALKYRILVVAALVWVTPAHAQLRGLGGLGGSLGNFPGTNVLQGSIGTLNRTTTGLSQTVESGITRVSRDVVGRPLQANAVARDPLGAQIVKGQIVAVSPTSDSLAVARRLNFTIVQQDSLAGLGLNTVTFAIPDGMNEASALASLRLADPQGSYDYDHIYNPTGSTVSSDTSAVDTFSSTSSRPVGMIDGGINTHHSSFADETIVTKTFAGQGDGPPTQHGTAIASLLIGRDGTFNGYLPSAKLYAADVFGGAADGGSAIDIARALNWLVGANVAVTNISLAGPSNAVLAAAVKAFVGSGHLLVAAVGNDGPAAPANYPASYDGVIGVTSVDSHNQLEVDANRAGAKFAARGVDVRAANLTHGYGSFTGTSYAAPLVTARFANLMDKPDPMAAKNVLGELSSEAIPLTNVGLYLDAPGVSATAAR